MGYDYRSLSLLPIALACNAGLRAADPAVSLHEVQRKVMAAVSHLQGYACAEQVQRDTYRHFVMKTAPGACAGVLEERNRLILHDGLTLFSRERLRLDVTLSSDGEDYAWAGASRFADGGLESVVRRGPISSGVYAGLLAVIFGADVKSFLFRGEDVVDGKSCFEYSFHVPLSDSHYHVKIDKGWVSVAYEGTLLIDPAVSEIIRIEVKTLDEPEVTSACETATRLDFGSGSDNATGILLPARSTRRFLYPTGMMIVNQTAFGACKEYRGFSSVTFGSEPETDQAGDAQKASPPRSIAPGLLFTTKLLEDIHTDDAAAGDIVHAALVNDLRDAQHKLIAQAGSSVELRLLRVEIYPEASRVDVVLAPAAIWLKQGRVRFAAELDWNYLVRMVRIYRSRNPGKPAPIMLPAPEERPSGQFRFAGKHVVVPRGFRSDWRTASPQKPAL